MKTARLMMAAWLAAVTIVGLWTPSDSKAQTALRRLAAEFRNFDGTESVTGAGVPGALIWTKTIFVPSSDNVLYVTLSTTGDTHDGAASWFTCMVDGAFCNPGSGGAAGAPPGWIALLKEPAGGANANCNNGGGGPGDCHDNGIYYTWCTKIDPGTHTVELRMASGAPPALVFIEAAHFYIDSNQFFTAALPQCTRGRP